MVTPVPPLHQPSLWSTMLSATGILYARNEGTAYGAIIPLYESIHAGLKSMEVHHLTPKEAADSAKTMQLLHQLLSMPYDSLMEDDLKGFDKGSKEYNDFVHFRNLLSKVLALMAELEESLSLLSDESFNTAYNELTQGDISNFVKSE